MTEHLSCGVITRANTPYQRQVDPVSLKSLALLLNSKPFLKSELTGCFLEPEAHDSDFSRFSATRAPETAGYQENE